MASNYAESTNAIKLWTRNQILKAGRLLVHMAGISLPKAVPISLSSDTGQSKNTTTTTADAMDGTNPSAKDLDDFWYHSEEVWPPKDK